MKLVKVTTAAVLAASLAACSSPDFASRNAPLDVPALAGSTQELQRSYSVTQMNFGAPTDLNISEGNGYYPFADVVWRGDPIGDRVEQIAAMFQTALDRNADDISGTIPVTVDLQLVRFHGVTERTRFSVGGVYNIKFMMTVRHAETGAVIEEPRLVVANLSAPGGAAAIMAEQRGQTEKVRVTDFLTQVMRDELTGGITA